MATHKRDGLAQWAAIPCRAAAVQAFCDTAGRLFDQVLYRHEVGSPSDEHEGFARQSNHFLNLYRECLSDFKSEMEAKHRLLELGNFKDPSIQTGQINTQAQSAVGSYLKCTDQKVFGKTMPSQMDKSEAWTKFSI